MGRKLVVSFSTLAQEFQALQAADAQTAGKRLGFDVDVLDANDSTVAQIQALFRVVRAPEESRPSAILVQTRAADALEEVARKAASAGIAWVLLNRSASYIDDLRRAHAGLQAFCVTTDNEEIGRIQGRQFRALLPKGGALFYVQGPPEAASAQARFRAMTEGIKDAGIDVKVVTAEWTSASAERAVSSWLQRRVPVQYTPGVVGCQNDEMAEGARLAFRAVRPDSAKIPFTGCDGLPNGGLLKVEAGELAATIIVDSCAGIAVEALARSLRSGSAQPATVLVPPRPFPSIAELAKAAK